MAKHQKIYSVLELARYQVGNVAWRVALRQPSVADLDNDDKWMLNEHPKTLFTRGPHKKLWSSRSILPKLQAEDFYKIVELLTSTLVIEQFPICDIIHNKNTGEFYYSNENGEWTPDDALFDTNLAAERERIRILRLLRKWSN
jgi:hypothetical protein